MLSEEDFALFTKWRVGAFGRKLREIAEGEEFDGLTFEEKVGLCIEAEIAARESRKIDKAVRAARFKIKNACVEEVLYLPDRSITRDRIARLAECAWVAARENLVIISESGGGKSYIAQALGVAACRKLMSVRYARLNDMFRELNIREVRGLALRGARPLRRSGPAGPRRLLHHAAREPGERGGPVRDTGGARGARVDAHRVPARPGPVVPEDKLGPVRRLHPQPHHRARQVP